MQVATDLFLPGNVKRGPAFLVLLGGLRSLVEQDGSDVGVAVERCQVQGRPAPVVSVDVDAVLEQRADGVRLPVPVRDCAMIIEQNFPFYNDCKKFWALGCVILCPGFL